MSENIYRETSNYANGVIFLDCHGHQAWVMDYSQEIHSLMDIQLIQGSLTVAANDVETVINSSNSLVQFNENDKIKLTILEDDTIYKMRWAVKNPPAEPIEETTANEQVNPA